MRNLREFAALGDGVNDDHHAFAAAAAALAGARGTLYVPDGVYATAQTIFLPQGTSLCLAPGATLKALPEFQGSALVETAAFTAQAEPDWQPQVIEGGLLDGASLPITGIRTRRDRETDIRNLTVRNCCGKGIHIGTEGCCETNLQGVRVQCERGVIAGGESIGIHYEKTTDSLVSNVIVIGYATGVRSDSSSNDFHQVHVWSYDENARLKTCFHCNGWNDSWNQCYADSPMNGDEEGYGFYIEKPFNRFVSCRVYGNNWVTPDRATGFFITDTGSHGTFLGNHLTAREGHELRAGIAGNLTGITALGNTYAQTVRTGRLNTLPSRCPDDSVNEPLRIDGDRIGLARPLPAEPAAEEGAVGDLGWVEEGDSVRLLLKTAAGWRQVALQ